MVISCLAVKAKEKSSDSQWLRSVVSSGTLKDKVAALTIQVQVSFFSIIIVMLLSLLHCFICLSILIFYCKILSLWFSHELGSPKRPHLLLINLAFPSVTYISVSEFIYLFFVMYV